VVRPDACRPEPSCVGPASDTIDGERRMRNSQGGLQPPGVETTAQRAGAAAASMDAA
jgi:hypothetical protein